MVNKLNNVHRIHRNHIPYRGLLLAGDVHFYSVFEGLTHFKLMSHFSLTPPLPPPPPPEKRQKIISFLTFSQGVKMQHWLKYVNGQLRPAKSQDLIFPFNHFVSLQKIQFKRKIIVLSISINNLSNSIQSKRRH